MRPVYGLTVLRYEDGRTEVIAALDGGEFELPVPESWQLRHDMLIDALAEVKREAGVIHTGPDPDEKGFLDKVAAELRKDEPLEKFEGLERNHPTWIIPESAFIDDEEREAGE